MTTCYRFDLDPRTGLCHTCGRMTETIPGKSPGNYSRRHVGDDLGRKLADLVKKRQAAS